MASLSLTVVFSVWFCPSKGSLLSFPSPCSHVWPLPVLQRDWESSDKGQPATEQREEAVNIR